MLFSREIICSFPFIYIWLRHGTLNLLEGQWDGLFATCQALVIHQASNISDTGFQNRVFQLVVVVAVVVCRFLSIVTIFSCYMFVDCFYYFIFLQFTSPLRYSHKCFCLCCFALVSYRCCRSCGCCCCCCLLLLFVAVDCCCCLLLLLLMLLSSSFLFYPFLK